MPQRRVSAKQLLTIVEMYTINGSSCEELGQLFDVSSSTIRRLIVRFEHNWGMSLLRVPGRPIQSRRLRVPEGFRGLIANLRRGLRDIQSAKLIEQEINAPVMRQSRSANESAGLSKESANAFDALLETSAYRDAEIE